MPKNFKEETTTVWSYKQRGDWATHDGRYRGNWSPYIPRNIILKYSKPKETVLDYFVGGGTTAIEAKLLGRKCIAKDINPACIGLTKENLSFKPPTTLFEKFSIFEPNVYVGDARDLSELEDNSIDLICTHPPYAGIINYSSKIEGDLSKYNVENFLKEMNKIAHESYRVLKPERKCAILVGDTRKRRHVVPIGFWMIDIFLNAGFKLKELVIKRQHNCKTTGFWVEKSIKYNFLLLAHEYLPIFEKSKEGEEKKLIDEVSSDNIKINVESTKPLISKDCKLETTSVWIFPPNEYNMRLDSNVIRRYSKGNNYQVLSLEVGKVHKEHPLSTKTKDLLFIKSPLLNNTLPKDLVNSYLYLLKDIVDENLKTISPNGFIVIQTKDIRINGYIEPLAKRIADNLNRMNNLWLKEIVVITSENISPAKVDHHNDLQITHQYLLIYEIIP